MCGRTLAIGLVRAFLVGFVCCQGFSDWRGFFLTEALVQFLFEFRLQRIDVASVASGVSVF